MVRCLSNTGLLLIASLFVAKGGHSATITVDSLADGITHSECTLRAAIESVNLRSDQGGCLPDGSYGLDDRIEFEPRMQGEIRMTADFFEIDAVSLVIDGSDADITIDANGHDGIFSFRGGSLGDAEFGRIAGLTLVGGVLRSFSAELEVDKVRVTGNRISRVHDGGGIFVSNAQLTVTNSEVTDNHAIGGCSAISPGSTATICVGGGGIGVRDGDAIIVNSTVGHNRVFSPRPRGGGIVVRGGDLALIDSLIADNSLDDSNLGDGTGPARGAGVLVEFGDATLLRTRISDNSMNLPGWAGGLGVPNGSLQASECRIVDNFIQGDQATGAGVRLASISAVHQISDCEISNNVLLGGGAAEDMGGAGIFARAELTLLRSSITGNVLLAPGMGSGIRASGDVTLLNSTVAGNEGWGALGAGIHVSSTSGPEPVTLTLTHSTVHDNHLAGQAGVGGIRLLDVDGFLDVVFTADNSIISQVADEGGGTPLACSRDLDGGGANLVTDDSCGGSGLLGGEPVAVGDLALEALADNGGATPTHALGPESVARDAVGDCLADFGLDHDQRGASRPGGELGECDGGAYEYQEVPEPEADLSVTKSVKPDSAAVGGSVVFVLDAENLGPDPATGVQVTDLLPDGYDFVSAVAESGEYEASSGLWSVGDLAAGSSATLSIEATVTDSGSYFNAASISADPSDPVVDNNDDWAEVAVADDPPGDSVFTDRFESP